MKQGEGKDVAHDYYVYQQMTFDEIARRTQRTDKTIRAWATEGEWREERERLFKKRISTHEKLHTVVDTIAESIITDAAQGKEPSPQRILALNKLANTIKSLYDYEGDVISDKSTVDESAETTDGLSDEAMRKIEMQMKIL